MPGTWRYPVLVALVAALTYFTNLGSSKLWDRDEPRNAGAAREMLDRGDWVVPTFNGKLRGHKPALLYWFIMAAYQAFGVNEFSARFFSAVFGVGAALLTYELGRMFFHPRVGLWSGIALATSLNFGVVARAATPDSVFIFFATLSLAVFAWGVRKDFHLSPGEPWPRMVPPQRISYSTWSITYLVMGIAVLAKGIIGFLLPTAIIGAFLLYARPAESRSGGDDPTRPLRNSLRDLLLPWHPSRFLRTAWSMKPWLLASWVILVAGPWYVAVGVRTAGNFWAVFFGEHHMGRFLHSMENHDGPFYFYVVAILLGFFPWSCFLIPVCRDGITRIVHEERAQEYRFLFSWVLVYVVFFSIARTKLPSYILPTYPALAILTGAFVENSIAGATRSAKFWTRLCLGCLAGGGVVLCVAGFVVSQRQLPGEWPLGMIGLIPLGGAFLAWRMFERSNIPGTWLSFAGSAVALAVTVFGFGTTRVDRHQTNKALMAFATDASHPVRAIASFGVLEPSWVFYGGYPIVECGDARAVRDFFQERDGKYLITTRDRWREIRDEVSIPLEVVAERSKFLASGTWIVLAASPAEISPVVARRLD